MKYIDHIIEQFIKANGITKYDYNSKEFLREFCEWVEERQILGKHYTYLLSQMGIDIDNYSTAEVGKTSFDSIGRNQRTTIITPYIYGFERSNRIIESPLIVDSFGNPIISYDKEKLEYIDRFITQNPYNNYNIENWDKLHNSGSNIVVGIYGTESDKDIVDKIELINEFKELLNDDYIEEETTIYNTYCKVVVSKRKILEKKLVKY